MSRRNATPEQIERAKERRAKLREIAQRISKMPDAERMALVQDWPTTIEGHRLSLHNALMIAFQGGGASVVGGFQQWRKAGRMVTKGQHGFGIWFPIGGKKDGDNGGSDGDGEPNGSDGDRVRFGIATVFDITQTQPQADSQAAEVVA